MGVERDPAALALAHENVALNGAEDRVQAASGDVAAPDPRLTGFDHAFANPPFFDDPSALRGPAPERRGAWIADDGLEAWTAFLLRAVRPLGAVTLIHRADRLADVLALLSKGAGSLQVRAVHPDAASEAKRVLVRAVKGGRASLRLAPPLILHGVDGRPTAETDAVLRGEAALPFDPPPSLTGRIHVRAYREADAPGLLDLFRRSVREAAAPFYSEAQRRAWAPDAMDLGAFAARRAATPTWVAEIDGDVAGFIDLTPSGHVDMLYVGADHQRRGVACALYRVVEAKAAGQGIARLTTEASLGAQPFFAARGFKVVREQAVALRGETLANALMEKRLSPQSA
jgi:predicted N-acetyltransferase YhbS